MKVNNDIKAVDSVLSRGVQEVVVDKDLRKKLLSGKQLRVKHGVDPTSKDLTLGHAVVYEKMRQLQEMGHKIVFLIGSFTARFGDPTDKAKARDMRDKKEVLEMGKNYVKQLSKILDIKKVEIRYNGEWYDKFSGEDMLRLMSKFTIARMLERDMFKKRIKDEKEIYYHEPVYPILQGYDSVELKSDVTVIGSDQKFNELQARPLQEDAKQVPQDLIIMPLLVGTDGVKKMSQSLGNYIGIADPANEQFGKIMSIPDTLIYNYFESCTRVPEDELAEVEQLLKSDINPRDIKIRLAKEIVTIYHSAKEADKAAEEFANVFSNKQKPTDMAKKSFTKGLNTLDLLVELGMVKSKGEARRLVEQNGVKVNDSTIETWEKNDFKSGDIIQVGKRKFVELK
jgi:tyrosyl-tRNA synthetase